MTNLGKKVPHDLILVAALLVGRSHVVRHVEDVPEHDHNHHHQDEDLDHHHNDQDGEDGDDGDDDGNMIFAHCSERGELLKERLKRVGWGGGGGRGENINVLFYLCTWVRM